jgi:prephenate dehydratase
MASLALRKIISSKSIKLACDILRKMSITVANTNLAPIRFQLLMRRGMKLESSWKLPSHLKLQKNRARHMC